MLDELKDLFKMKQQAKQLQDELGNQRVTGTSRDGRYSIVMNGNQEVLDVFVPSGDLVKTDVEEGIKEAFHDARQKIEALLRDKMTGLMSNS